MSDKKRKRMIRYSKYPNREQKMVIRKYGYDPMKFKVCYEDDFVLKIVEIDTKRIISLRWW